MPLTVTEALTDQPSTIPAKSVYTAHKTLGHYKAPAGDNSTQRVLIRTKSDAFAKMVITSPCNRMDSWFFYTAIYLKLVRYVLPNCFFTPRELQKIQQEALHTFLAKCGYNSKTHQSIVFAPISFGGCGFCALYLLQGEGQILIFLKNWQADTQASRLLCIAVSWTQLYLGTSFCCLQDTTTPLPHMPGRWLKLLRSFLATIDGALELDHQFLPPTQRLDDMYLMNLVLQSAAVTEPEIKRINYF